MRPFVFSPMRIDLVLLGLALVAAQLSADGQETDVHAVRLLSNTTPVDVIIVAHADDWQVFMSDAVVERIKSGHRPVFIYLTAGDDGRENAYWRQRETAALQSSLIAIGAASTLTSACDTARIRGHAIRRCTAGQATSYFLRLPDGNRDGTGFVRNQFASLRKLRSARIAGIRAVDSSARYSSWQDLAATLSALVRTLADSASTPRITLHTTDPSVRVNPHDHYDHRVAGKLVESLLNANDWTGRYYVGYALATRAANRTPVQRQEKLSVFSAYDREMIRVNPMWSAYREHPAFYAACMQRTYARTAPRLAARSRQ